MVSNFHTSLKVRLDNNIVLYVHLEKPAIYKPTSLKLKAAAIKLLLTTKVKPSIAPYRNTKHALYILQGNTDVIFEKDRNLAIEVNIETIKTFYCLEFYDFINHLVRLITGEKVSRYSDSHTHKEDDTGTHENEAEGTAVSQFERTSKSGNHKSLIEFLNEKGKYDPEDADLKISEQQNISDDTKAPLKELCEKRTALTNARLLSLKFFDSPGGLHEIAARAKRYVKRNYGKDSLKYKNFMGSLSLNENHETPHKNKTFINI